jgi:3-hydroxymyristoyl/3-hydroxydecanoyl-(acyl carrier protein) dehydratase
VTATLDHGGTTVPYAAPARAVDAWHSRPTPTGRTVTARLRVDPDEANLRGHFPGFPVLPGVFVVEALCQAVALSAGDGPPLRLREVESVRFLAPLLAGDELTLAIDVVAGADGGCQATAEGRRGDGSRAAQVRARFDTGAGTGTAVNGVAHLDAVDRQFPDVRRVLPQRYPLLLVDRVEATEPGQSIRTVKAVTATEPCYAGLPDDAPLDRYAYPRSLLIESFGQSAALLWLDGDRPAVDDAQVLLFVGARGYRFEHDAYPGDLLRHEVRLDSVVADTAFASGATWAGGRRVATVAALMAARRPRLSLATDGRSTRSGQL